MSSITPEHTCRLCTNRGKDYHAIFTSNSSFISDKINNCLPIVISPDDGLPAHICTGCLKALNASNALREQSLAADKFLRQQFTAVFIKQEHDISDDETKEEPSQTVFCGICTVKFNSIQSFKEHMKTAHSSEWVCNVCNRNFKTSGALLQHKNKIHYDKLHNANAGNVEKAQKDGDHLDDDDSDQPMDNDVNFVDVGNLEEDPSQDNYSEIYQSGAEKRYACTKCNETFLTLAKLTTHVDEIHEKKRLHACEICSSAFTTKRNLRAHRKRHANMTCQECGQLFTATKALHQHLLSVHNVTPASRKYACKECDRTFGKPRLLKDHMNCHSGNRPHVCKFCKKTFRTYAARWGHMQKHMFDKLICDHCQGQFLSKNLLRRHMARHLPPENWRFVCKLCDERFHRKSYLETHIKKHNDTRPFLCVLCDSRYLTENLLKKHQRRHAQPHFTKPRMTNFLKTA